MVLDLASLPRWAVAGIAHLIFLDGSPRACLVELSTTCHPSLAARSAQMRS
jgi:hypothetical protein